MPLMRNRFTGETRWFGDRPEGAEWELAPVIKDRDQGAPGQPGSAPAPTPSSEGPRGAAPGAGQNRPILMRLANGTILYVDQWQQFVTSLPDGYLGYTGGISTDAGKLRAITSIRQFEGGQFRPPEQTEGTDFDADLAALLAGLGGGGGGGGGFAGPTFVAPDEEQVREGLALYVSTVVGEEDGGILDEAVRIFMATARKDFDNEGQRIDATTAAKKYVRSTAPYKDIHELRPDNVDELKWVTSPQGQLRKLGVSGQTAEQLGIELARVAGSEQDVQKAGETAFSRQSGRIHTDQRNRLKAKASAAAQLL